MLAVDYEVKSKDFKTMFTLITIDFLFDWAKSHISDFFYSIPNVVNYVLSHEFFQTPKGQLICILKLPIIWWIFLNGIIGKMDEVIIYIVGWKGLSWSS